MDDIKICLATQANITDIANLEKMCFSMPWSEKSISDSLNLENTLFIVAYHQDKVVGYIGAYKNYEDVDITNIAVNPECRRKKIATQMLIYLLGILDKKTSENVFLEVRKSNLAAIKLYENNGFEMIGTRKNFYEKPLEDALLYKYSL